MNDYRKIRRDFGDGHSEFVIQKLIDPLDGYIRGTWQDEQTFFLEYEMEDAFKKILSKLVVHETVLE